MQRIQTKVTLTAALDAALLLAPLAAGAQVDQMAVDGVARLAMTRGWSIGSLADLRARLSELVAERIFARSSGMAADAAYMTDLEDEVAEVTAVYFGAAVTGVRNAARRTLRAKARVTRRPT